MELLNIIGLILWVVVGFRCCNLLFKLQRAGNIKLKILVMIIMLLAGLNICRSFISVNLNAIQVPGFMLLSYFYIGTSVFQLLLSHCVLERVDETLTPDIQED